jgi:branched-chain amino acid transport system substrate-binding protein
LNDDYSIDLKGIFSKLLRDNGGVIVNEVGFESEETDFKAQLRSMKSSDVEAIICFAQHVQVSRVVVRAEELNIDKPILSGETAYTDKLLETVGSAENLYVTGVSTENNDKKEHFETMYKEKYGKNPGPYGTYTFDAVRLAIEIIATQKPSNGKQLLNDLKTVKDFIGASGSITFNEKGDVSRDYEIYKLQENKFIVVE